MKPNICKHCQAVDNHFSFQCPTQRKPIKKGDIFKHPTDGTFKVVKVKPVKKKSIAPVSDSQKKKLAEYRVVRDKYMKEHPICEAKVPHVCTHHSIDLHHCAGRGKNLSNVEYFLAICRSCHTWIHENDKQAREMGLLISRL